MVNYYYTTLFLIFHLVSVSTVMAQEPCDAETISFDQEYCGQTVFNIYNPPPSQVPCPTLVGSSSWYKFEISPDNAGVEIDFTGESCCEYQLVIGRFNGGCSGEFSFSTFDAYCFSEKETITKYCASPGTYYLYVGTTSAHQGTFCFTASEVTTPSECEVSFDCEDAIELDISDFNTIVCVDGCNIGNCGENLTLGDCTYNSGIAWFKVTIPWSMGANSLSLTVTSHDQSLMAPKVQAFRGNCNSLTPLSQCNVGSNGTVNLLGIGVSPSQDVYIAVTNDSRNPGNFELCVSLLQSTGSSCFTGGELIVNARSIGGSLEGPYFPNEQVSFTFNWSFTSVGNGIQWPHAIIPIFGECWDIESSTLPNYGNWTWFDEGVVTYNLDNTFVFTYDDPVSGDIKLCYWLDPSCEGEHLTQGTLMPAGWYHINQPGQCGTEDLGNPNNTWGAPCVGTCGGSFNFVLRTKPFEECSPTQNVLDCGIQFFVFSDFQTGCWFSTQSDACLKDQPHYFNANMICCFGCNVYTDSPDNTFELCSCDTTEIFLYADEAGPNTEFTFTIERPSGIIGGSHGTTTDAIRQRLCNTTSDTLDVLYFVGGTDSIGCYSAEETMITVRVLPQFFVELDETGPLCVGDSFLITPNITGGNGQPFNYEWHDGSNNDHITVVEDIGGRYRYAVTVTDTTGCRAISHVFIDYQDYPRDELRLEVDEDNLGTITYDVANPNAFTYEWSNGETGHIISDVPPGAYSVTVTTSAGCSSVFSIEFEECSLIVVTHNIDFFTCEGIDDGFVEVTTVNEHGSVSFLWNDGFVGSQRDSLGSGMYIVTATDEQGCTSQATFELEAKRSLNLELDDSYYFCEGQSVSITIDRPMAEINWSNGQTGPSIDVSQTGQVTVMAVDTIGCIGRDTVNIYDLPLPYPNIEIEEPYICHDDTITVCTDDVYEIMWSTDVQAACTEVFGLREIGLQAWSLDGCYRDTIFELPPLPDAIEIDVLEIQHPTSELMSDGSISIRLKGGIEPYFVEWYDANQLIASEIMDIDNLSYGEYFLHISDVLGCTKRFGPFILDLNTSTTVVEELLMNVFPNPFDEQFNITLSRETRPIQLIIRNLNGSILYNNSDFEPTKDINVSTQNWPPGSYNVELILQEGKIIRQMIKQ